MPITVKSGFWNDSYSFIKGNNPLEGRLKNLMRRRGMQVIQGLTDTLLGAAAGSTATRTYKRQAGDAPTAGNPTTVGSLGGIRAMETRTQLNRATTAADDTRITNVIKRSKLHTSVSDRSGNGK